MLVLETSSMLTQDVIDRWTSHLKPLPLPDHITPLSGCPLAAMDDDSLMIAPPHLIAHVQRTAAQGGMQVISPRQTPFTSLMTRSIGGDRQLGDHVVGSTADETAEWPTLDDMDFSHLLPDEPLPSISADHGLREKTRTEGITKAGHLLSDPILSCLIKGRAVIDVLRREDVAGDADAMTELLSSAWGITPAELNDMDAFTVGIQGPLVRHAIKADEVFPMTHAPIHVKRVVSTGVSEVTRELLPDDSAMDWRRMRVFCEAVFLLAVGIEGLPIKRMRVSPPPGDPAAPSNRPGVMVFQPAPATAWCCTPDTFSIYPSGGKRRLRSAGIPREVLEALARYTSVVRPVSYAMAVGHRAVARRAVIEDVLAPPGETISEGYRLVARCIMVGSARGRTAAATVRNHIFLAIQNAPLAVRLRLARYLRIASDECRKHLGLEMVPDSMVDKLASRFLKVGELVRMEVVGEAARRGATANEWWSDITAQAAERYTYLTEGTMGWAKIAMWLLFRSPTDKWRKLASAVHYGALRDAERSAVGAIALPAEKGSKERLLAAARAGVRNISKAYAGYYIGVADVGLAMSDVADEMMRSRTADLLREASYLWHLRARCLRGTNVNPIAKLKDTPSSNHRRVSAMPIDLLLVPSPYRAFEAYKKHVGMSTVLPHAVKKHFQEFEGSRVSEAFTRLNRPMGVIAESTLTSFLLRPHMLGHEMEMAWRELTDDVKEIARVYGARPPDETVATPVERESAVRSMDPALILSTVALTQKDYFAILADMGEDEVDWVENTLSELPEELADQLMEAAYPDANSLRKVLLDLVEGRATGFEPVHEVVR